MDLGEVIMEQLYDEVIDIFKARKAKIEELSPSENSENETSQ